MTESPVLKVELRITDDACETPGRIRRRVSATVWLEGSDSKRYLNGCLIAAPTGTLETDYIETDEIGMGDDAKAGEALLALYEDGAIEEEGVPHRGTLAVFDRERGQGWFTDRIIERLAEMATESE